MTDLKKSPSSTPLFTTDEPGEDESTESNNREQKPKRGLFSFNIDDQNAVEMMDDESDSDDNLEEVVTNINTNTNPNTNTNTHLIIKTSPDPSAENTNKVDQNPNDLNENERITEKTEDNTQIKQIEDEENEDRKRFQIELEFVQSLANPNYLNYLAQRGYFKNQTFLNYLKYLMYWKEPEYCKYIVYPQCLSLLEMLQHEQFLKEIVNAQCAKYIDEQLLLLWLHYKKKHDWIRIDPTKIPDNIEKLFSKESMHDETTTDSNNNIQNDPFSASKFIENEKF